MTDNPKSVAHAYAAAGSYMAKVIVERGSASPAEARTSVTARGFVALSVSAGEESSCGVISGGAAYCWGHNAYGQLGDGDTTSRTTPVPVSGGVTFAQLGPGFRHTCGLTTGGAAYCWGSNELGQLGDGTTTGPQLCSFAGSYGTSYFPCSTTPMLVSGGLTFATVSAVKTPPIGPQPGKRSAKTR